MGRRRIVTAIVVYAVLAGIALAWIGLRGEGFGAPSMLGSSATVRGFISVGLGLALALGVIASTRVLVRRADWARELHISFRALLGPATGREIAILALTSGVAEELFFRSALQPAAGYVVASLAFGLVHFGGRHLLPWTLWAMAMGFALGALFAVTGSVVGCIAAHVLINYENLHFIAGHDPRADEPPPTGAQKPSPPTLIGTRRRAGTPQ